MSRDNLHVGIDQHHDRELEPLGLVDGHHAHAVASILEDRRLGGLGPVGGLAKGTHESAKRQPPVGFVAPGEIGNVQHVGQGLLSAGPEREGHMRPSRDQQIVQRVGNRAGIAPLVQLAEQREGIAHRLQVCREVLRYLIRMEPAEVVAVLQQAVVAYGEQSAPQRRKYGQLVVGPLDRRQRRANRLDFLTIVEGLAAHQQVRDVACFEGLHVRPGDVLVEAGEAAEQEAHVPRPDGDLLGLPCRQAPFGDRPLARVEQPLQKRPDGIGKRLLDCALRDVSRSVGAGHRQRDNRGLAGVIVARGRQSHVWWLLRHDVVGHQRRECRVHETLDGRRGTKAGRESRLLRVALPEPIADDPVGADVGPAEAVDGLLGIADDEKRPRPGLHFAPVNRADAIGVRRAGQEHHDLGLQRVGILELVDEQVRQPFAERPPDLGIVAQQVTRAQQQVHEIQRAFGRLQGLVPLEAGAQVLL